MIKQTSHEERERLSAAVESLLTPRRSPMSQRERELLCMGNPFSFSGGLAATTWGEGPTVLLAHGWESRRTHWGSFIPSLVTAGFRTIAVDAPAHGDSPGEQAHVLQFGLSLIGIAKEIGPLAGIVGHSFGSGAVALSLQKGLVAEKAILISGPASLRNVVERFGRGYGLLDDEIPHFMHLVEEAVGASIDSLDVASTASRQTCPALIVHDQRDKEIPVQEGMAVASNWPGARLLITERYGHRRILIAAEVVREVVAFLSGRTA